MQILNNRGQSKNSLNSMEVWQNLGEKTWISRGGRVNVKRNGKFLGGHDKIDWKPRGVSKKNSIPTWQWNFVWKNSFEMSFLGI